MSLYRALAAGAAGAAATNIAHETLRRTVPDAPRVDLLGMQGMATIASRAFGGTPTGDALYQSTLVTDVASNSAYFALVGAFPRRAALLAGTVLGAAAGAGSVLLPGPMGFDEKTTGRTPRTAALSFSLYLLGGIVAGFVYSRT